MKGPINRQEIEAFGRMDLIANQIVQGFITGLHKSPFHGFSVEFAEHRLYNPGEDTRHIDWRLYGRSEKLFIKQYEEETNLRCRFLIDTSSSMFYPERTDKNFNKIEFSAYAVAAFTEMLKRQRDAFGVSYFGSEVYYHSEVKSTQAHQSFLFKQLEQLLGETGKPESNIIQALHQIAEQVHKRSLVFIFSDMFDQAVNQEALFDALQHLRHNRHEVIIFHTVDKRTELDFDFGNRPVTFIDVETNRELKANPQQLKQAYTTRIKKYVDDLKIRCGDYRIDYVEADVSEGFNKILMSYLLKRQRMM
ncbi:MAG: DUF58 domain-containing protein [Bacteroidota bacterium]